MTINGAMLNNNWSAFFIVISSLKRSLTKSAMVWKTPKNRMTVKGCILLSIFFNSKEQILVLKKSEKDLSVYQLKQIKKYAKYFMNKVFSVKIF